jgi:hypothetical protein
MQKQIGKDKQIMICPDNNKKQNGKQRANNNLSRQQQKTNTKIIMTGFMRMVL